ncbi:neural cell adhesion molecule 1 isoform X1 [Alosa sapidissima]|uniref:neural cell adhesion molecule 1 isoform X1 n=1 Tax=Alosa sapidissima TaxID=34773 RepID=UPI001C08A467|nr:neural cell adhesion molecule 1 isoform X1 [Alosa sapidissima]
MAAALLLIRYCVLFTFWTLSDAKIEIVAGEPDVKVNDRYLLLCKAGGEGTITWFFNDEEVEEDNEDFLTEKLDETSSKLIINAAKLSNTGTYTCKCEYDSGGDKETSADVFVYEPITFGKTATYHEFLKGGQALIPCVATGKPAVEVQWYRSSTQLGTDGMRGTLATASSGFFCGKPRITVRPDNILQIDDIQREDRGTYTCKAFIKGRPLFETLDISVVVNTQPVVEIHEKQKTVKSGPDSTVSITCSTSGEPKPEITWSIPTALDSSRHEFNSDRSELTIKPVKREDKGEYICTAKNKIGESTVTAFLDVSEHPVVILSQSEVKVKPGEMVAVSCNISGHPMPSLQWIKKGPDGNTGFSSSGRIKVQGSDLIIEKVAPSDGGLYSCIANSSSGIKEEDFSLQTSPGKPSQVSVNPGAAAASFNLSKAVVDGGSTITAYILQWRQDPQQKWNEMVINSTDPLVATPLLPYSEYSFRLAARNIVGQGEFSDISNARTLGEREPDKPFLTDKEIKFEENIARLPFKQLDTGGSPISFYTVHYKADKDDEWREKDLLPNATEIYLHDLQYSSDYQLKIVAHNPNGPSMPAMLNFTVPQSSAVSKPGLGKGGVVGIVMLVFLVLLIAVDATCCYTNRCGMLMFLAVKLFGQKVPGSKVMEEGDGNGTAIDMKVNGLASPRGSIPKQQAQNSAPPGVQSEVTCDKAPLTKFEKAPANGDPTTDA